jgi:hypothetical protein
MQGLLRGRNLVEHELSAPRVNDMVVGTLQNRKRTGDLR